MTGSSCYMLLSGMSNSTHCSTTDSSRANCMQEDDDCFYTVY